MSQAPMVQLTLPDGSARQLPLGSPVGQLAGQLGPGLQRAALGALLDGRLVDLSQPVAADAQLRFVTATDVEALSLLRHTAAHVLAAAVQALHPGTQVTIGPVIEHGFYYDFARQPPFAPADLPAISDKMQQLIAADLPLQRQTVSRQEALGLFAQMGEEYKCQIIAGIDADEPLTIYRMGDWLDLCRGPHLPSSGRIGAFALTHTAGAYWRGDERQAQLSRIYGTAFFRRQDLAARLAQVEEAKRRDHRRLGRELQLFWHHPQAAAMPFFPPAGAVVYGQLQAMVRRFWAGCGFAEVITPQLFDADLFAKSGHLANYAENMYFVGTCSGQPELPATSPAASPRLALKPMNCPSHALLYQARPRSWRELPVRYADFGRLHRYERSGATAGLTRVRTFCQDDAHIFCMPQQIGQEIAVQLRMIAEIYQAFELPMRFGLSTRPERSLGREEGLGDAERAEWDGIWADAVGRLEEALGRAGLPYRTQPQEGAFYGPKIDCEVQDAVGRWHQLGTIQLDFGQPRRFGLSYIDAGGQAAMPVMVHRAVLGSVERFIGLVIEHTAGHLPLWLAPTQVRVLALNDGLLPAAVGVAEAFDRAGLRVVVDGRSDKLGAKIRDAQLRRVPVVAVVGPREVESGQVSLRWARQQDLAQLPLDQAVGRVLDAAAVPGPSPALLASVAGRLISMAP